MVVQGIVKGIENLSLSKMKELGMKDKLFPYLICNKSGTSKTVLYNALIGLGNSTILINTINDNPNMDTMDLIDSVMNQHYLISEDIDRKRADTILDIFILQMEISQRILAAKLEEDSETKIGRLLAFTTWLSPLYNFIIDMKLYNIQDFTILDSISSKIEQIDIESILENESQELIEMAKHFIVPVEFQ